MTTNECITALDDALAQNGQDVVLRRVVGSANIDVKCRASVRAFRPEELIGGITQSDSLVIMSPTQILAGQWPGGQVVSRSPLLPSTSVSPAWLPKNTDRVIVDGRSRAITFVKPISVGSGIVRLELTVAG
jgi:hypothetical protein